MSNTKMLHVLNIINPSLIVPVIENGIHAEKLNLEIHTALGNESECYIIKNRIADAKLFLLILSGDLPA